MSLTDLLAIYGSASGTVGTLIGCLAYRLAKRTAILDGPHIEIAMREARHPERIYFQLAGPRAEQFYVDRAELRWAVNGQICLKEFAADAYGQPEIVAVRPHGRSIEQPDSPLVLTEPLRSGAKIDFTLRAKANPRLKRIAPLYLQS